MTEKDPGQIELENQIAKNDLNATGAAVILTLKEEHKKMWCLKLSVESAVTAYKKIEELAA